MPEKYQLLGLWDCCHSSPRLPLLKGTPSRDFGDLEGRELELRVGRLPKSFTLASFPRPQEIKLLWKAGREAVMGKGMNLGWA